MKKCIPNREIDELGEGLVMTYVRKTGMKMLPKCVDIEGLADSLGLKVIYEEFAEDDYDKIGFLSNGTTPLKIKRGNRLPVYGDSVLASEDRTKINKMAAQIGVSFTALMIRLKTFQMLDYHPVYEYIEANMMKGVEM